MTTCSQPIASVPHARRACGTLSALVRRLRRSHSIASMLPSLLLSGVITLAMTAVMHLTWSGWGRGFVGAWMESWLTTWPLAFPLAYLLGPAMLKVTAAVSAPANDAATRFDGLALGDITQVSHNVTVHNGLTVLRKLRPAHDFSAV